ncbi:MAG: response regulator [Cyanobacteria bacterium P01_F01_bin.42]
MSLDASSPDSNHSQDAIQILIVDDQQFVRNMLEYSLSHQEGFQVVSLAASGREAIAQVKQRPPDIALVDVEMPDMNGLELTQVLAQQAPRTKVIILSIHDGQSYIRRALDAGAQGYLLKNTPPDDIAHAIRFVNRGYLHLGPGLFDKLEGELDESPPAPSHPETSSETSPPKSVRRYVDNPKDSGATRPISWRRRLIYGTLACLLGVIPWSVLTKVNQIVVARGTLEPESRTVRITAPFQATIASVYVQEGSDVKKGDPIVEFQSDRIDAELQQAQSVLSGLIEQRSQQELLKAQIVASIQAQQAQSQQTQAFEPAGGSTLRTDSIQLVEQTAQIEQAIAARDAAKRRQTQVESSYRSQQAELERYQELLQKGAIPSRQVVEVRRRVDDIQIQKADVDADVARTERQLQEARLSYEVLKAEAQTQRPIGQPTRPSSSSVTLSQSRVQLQDVESRMAKLTAQINESRGKIQALRRQQKQGTVYAPANGTIFQLAVQNTGESVRSAQPIANIAPPSAQLVLRGIVDGRDADLLKGGMPVSLKFDAPPASGIESIPGELTALSLAARSAVDSRSDEAQSDGSNARSYTVEIRPNAKALEAAQFKLGQTASAEIQVRQRRLINLVLDSVLSWF